MSAEESTAEIDELLASLSGQFDGLHGNVAEIKYLLAALTTAGVSINFALGAITALRIAEGVTASASCPPVDGTATRRRILERALLDIVRSGPFGSL